MPKLNSGRGRMIQPGFFTDERIMQLSPPARLLFLGLVTICDREGRTEEPHHTVMKARFFPTDSVDCAVLFSELLRTGLVRQYLGTRFLPAPKKVTGDPLIDDAAIRGEPIIVAVNLRLLWLPGFKQNNRPHPKEQGSCLTHHPMDQPNQPCMTEKVVPIEHATPVFPSGTSGTSGSSGDVEPSVSAGTSDSLGVAETAFTEGRRKKNESQRAIESHQAFLKSITGGKAQ